MRHAWLLGIGTGDLERALRDALTGLFKDPRQLTTVPANVTVLSFKVMSDGGLTVFLKPDDPAKNWAPVAQQLLDGLYRA